MPVALRFLRETDVPAMVAAFHEAFADYAVDMTYLTAERLRNRWTKNGVDYARSVGAFDGTRLVAFTALGIDSWQGRPAAFDAATAIVPEHRGAGLAGRLFEFALPKLREDGIRCCVLEVLQDNERAIKAYAKAGFRVTREFDAYRAVLADLPAPAASDIDVRPDGREVIAEFAAHFDGPPSWENSIPSLLRIPDELLVRTAHVGGQRAGLVVYYPGLGWITTLVVDRAFRRRGIGRALLAALRPELEGAVASVKLVHALHSDAALAAFLARTGFTVYARQFEMECLVEAG